MSFHNYPQLNSTPEARKAQVDLVRQEFAAAQNDGSILAELLHIARATLRLPWRLLTLPVRLVRRRGGEASDLDGLPR